MTLLYVRIYTEKYDTDEMTASKMYASETLWLTLNMDLEEKTKHVNTFNIMPDVFLDVICSDVQKC